MIRDKRQGGLTSFLFLMTKAAKELTQIKVNRDSQQNFSCQTLCFVLIKRGEKFSEQALLNRTDPLKRCRLVNAGAITEIPIGQTNTLINNPTN